MSNYKPIDVSTNANVTPITHKPIEQITPEEWGEISFSDLYNQLSILQNRLMVARSMDKPEMATQIQYGISQLEAVIQQRSSQQKETIL